MNCKALCRYLILLAVTAVLLSGCQADSGSPASSQGGTTAGAAVTTTTQNSTTVTATTTTTLPPKTPATFEKASVQVQGSTLKYWLYTPAGATADMPLIVYLHGIGGRGSNLDLVLDDAFPKLLRDGALGELPAYVVMPQLPAKKSWVNIKASLRELITHAQNTYQIDPNKVSLTGFSLGGRGAYEVALAEPQLFSCVVPVSGRVTTSTANVNKLKDMPVWAFVGTADDSVDPQLSIDFIAALEKVNAAAKITCFEGAAHLQVPARCYTETDVLYWMIAQSR